MQLSYCIVSLIILLLVTVNTDAQRKRMKYPNVVVNNYISLETDKTDGYTGHSFIFYISYTDALFGSKKPVFKVIFFNPQKPRRDIYTHALDDSSVLNSTKTYTNVKSFVAQFEKSGTYSVIIIPRLIIGTRSTDLFVVTDKGREIAGGLNVTVNVISPNETDSVLCDFVGQFTINYALSSSDFVSRQTKVHMFEHVHLKVYEHDCKSWQSWRSKWTIEKIYQPLISAGIFQTINPSRIQEMNYTAYSSQIIRIPLPLPSRESEVIIQPYTLPPGWYRISNSVVQNDVRVTRYTLLEVVPSLTDCTSFMPAIRIQFNHELEEFTWPMKDLTIVVVEFYSIYAVFDAAYSVSLQYKHRWSCSGDVLCLSLQQLTRVEHIAGTVYQNILLPNTGVELTIPAAYMNSDTTVILRFTLEYNHPLYTTFTCSGFGVRKVTFVSTLHQGVNIRCYLNCWYYVNIQAPLLVGIECDGCTLTQANSPTVNWTVSDLPNAVIFDHDSMYLLVKEFGQHVTSTFLIRALVNYTNSKGEFESMNLGKLFRFTKSISTTPIRVNNYFEETERSRKAAPGDIEVYFPTYSINTKAFFNSVYLIIKEPIVVMVTQLPDEDDELKNNENITNYVLLRTMWAPYDVCIESFQNISTDNISSVKLKFSTTVGLEIKTVVNTVFKIQRETPLFENVTELPNILSYVQDRQYFSVNDQTYLLSFSRAIMIASRNYSSTRIRRDTESGYTFKVRLLLASPTNNSDDTANATFEIKSELSTAVESILDSMNGRDESALTYSNINLYLVTLIRVMSIREYSLSILKKGIEVLVTADRLHQESFEDPSSDDDIIRLKLEATYAITLYLLGFKNENPRNPWNRIQGMAIFDIMSKILTDIPKRLPMKFPTEEKFGTDRYTVKARWLHHRDSTNNIKLDLNFTKITIHYDALMNSSLCDIVMNTFINMAAYSSLTSPLPAMSSNLPPSSPMIQISISMKQPTLPPLTIDAPGAYDITFANNRNIKEDSVVPLRLGIYATFDQLNVISSSDCLFFRVEASTRYASIFTFSVESNLTLSIKIKLADSLGAGLTAIDHKEIFLPRVDSVAKSCGGDPPNPYSILLPALTLRQESEMKDTIGYYIMLSVASRQPYLPAATQTPVGNLMQVGHEIINFTCVRITCLQMEDTHMSTKACKVSPCTGNVPDYVTCRCDRGRIFSAEVDTCNTFWFSDHRDFLQIKEMDPSEIVIIIPAAVICVWFIFGTLLVIARRQDAKEKPLGKTFALQGVYNPYKCEQYLMCFVTGFGRGCGTTCTPYMTIIGTNSVSPRYKLDTSEVVFVSGSEVWVMVSVPEDLGRPRRIIVSLEKEYSRVSTWFIKELYIRHIQSGEQWTCPFNNWIPDTDNYNFNFCVNDVRKKRGSVAVAFATVLVRLIRNQHPVFGIRYNIPGSSFTKAQHVALCMCGVLILMWFCLQAQDLPTLKLPDDYESTEKFSINIEMYIRSAYSALLTVLPFYFLGVLLESSRQIDTRNVEWRQLLKHPDDRVTAKNVQDSINDAAPMKSINLSRISETSISTDQSVNISDAHMINISNEGENNEENTNVSNSGNITPEENLIEYNAIQLQESPNISQAQSFMVIEKEENKNTVQTICSWIFQIPCLVSLALITVIIVSISYYILVLGLFFTTVKSLEYLYMVSVAFLILILLLYPILLVMIAIFSIIQFRCGYLHYGIKKDSVSRISSISSVLSSYVDMAMLDVVETRTRSVGDLDQEIVKDKLLRRSHNWCKQLILRRKAITRKQIRYNNYETVTFIFLVLVIINVQVGSVSRSFLQTQFIANSLNVHRVSEEPEQVLTTDIFWDHLQNIFTKVNSWKFNNSLIAMKFMSASKVRQVRVMSYQGNCIQDYPDLIEPRCLMDVEASMLETRPFANTWNTPLENMPVKTGPYNYRSGGYFEQVVTEHHIYQGGGYELLISGSKASLETLSYLRTNKWVDDQTKAISVSMNFINIDSALSTVIDHIYEFRLAGIFMYTVQIYSFPLKFTPYYEIIQTGLVVIFGLMSVYFLLSEIKSCFESGFVEYFTFSQSWFLLLERFLCIGILLLYFWLMSDKNTKLRQVHDAHLDEVDDILFIDFNIIASATFNLVLVSCLLVVMCLIKSLLRFRDYVLLATFVNMIPSAIKSLYIPVICIIAFAFLGLLLFQSLLHYYKTFASASATITVLMLETSALVPTAESTYLGGTFITILYCVMFYIILNYFIVLINEAYSEYKRLARLQIG